MILVKFSLAPASGTWEQFQSSGKIAMKFTELIHAPQKMNNFYFGYQRDTTTWIQLVSSSSQSVTSVLKVLNTIYVICCGYSWPPEDQHVLWVADITLQWVYVCMCVTTCYWYQFCQCQRAHLQVVRREGWRLEQMEERTRRKREDKDRQVWCVHVGGSASVRLSTYIKSSLDQAKPDQTNPNKLGILSQSSNTDMQLC